MNNREMIEAGYMSSANAYVPKKKELQIERDPYEYRPTSVNLEREDLRAALTGDAKEENKNKK